jgi:hypothetical protein
MIPDFEVGRNGDEYEWSRWWVEWSVTPIEISEVKNAIDSD